jgi:hypothetical protein
MPTYSKNYQTVIAGRVRENEVGFEKDNSVATPARVFSQHPKVAIKNGTLSQDFIGHDEEMGKKRSAVSKAWITAGDQAKYQ